MNECLRYKDAEPMLRKVNTLMADENGLRTLLKASFKKVYRGDAETQALLRNVTKTPGVTTEQLMEAEIDRMVGEVVENLKWRHKYLDGLMKGLDERNYLPVRGQKTSRVLQGPWKVPAGERHAGVVAFADAA